MISSTELLLIVFAVFSTLLTFTQAFCVYNHMSSKIASVDLFDAAHDGPKSFKKVINGGGTECCHWFNSDCNPSGLRNGIIYLHGWLNFNGLAREGRKKVFKCDAGGSINIFGTSVEDAYAICYYSDGILLSPSLWDLE